jgi:fatty-acyl-CoA synthase
MPQQAIGSVSRASSTHAWRRALELTASIHENTHTTLPVILEDLASRSGDSFAVISKRHSLTYQALNERSNQYARWALAQGLQPGDVVALLMTNSPEYLAAWLGMTRIGIVVALLNTNLVGDSLVYSINLVAPQHIIADGEVVAPLVVVGPLLDPRIKCWVQGRKDDRLPRIDAVLDTLSGAKLNNGEFRAPSLEQPALYIYTSGTTGLSKAAVVSHLRLMQWSHWFAGMIGVQADDRMYNCLPMYHSVGGVVAPGAVLVGGGCLVIRNKFSAKQFWDDIARWDCTLLQYVGELCRYLLAGPPHPREATHRIRLCCGNGLRQDVWHKFQQRFKIPQILEFYAATEGSFSLYNAEGKPGAIGRIPPFLRHRFPVAIIKGNGDSADPSRDEYGLCVRCKPGEIGEAIGQLSDGGNAAGRFEGYTDKTASEKKVLRNVFVQGDAWFRSGDLMRFDESGYFYFVDRIGDTFRWKGENVSTTEVEAVIATCPGISEAVVYGVTVPYAEGRVGMAAIVTTKSFDLSVLEQRLEQKLPEYARPAFMRRCHEIARTETFKPQKARLARDGFDPAAIEGTVYFRPEGGTTFEILDADTYVRIQQYGLSRDNRK